MTLNRLDTLTHYRSTGNSVADVDLSDNRKVAEFDYSVRVDGQRTGLVEKFWVDDDQTADVINTYQWEYDGLDRLVDEYFSTNLDELTNGLENLGLEAVYALPLLGWNQRSAGPPIGILPRTSRALRDYHDEYQFDLTGNRLSKWTDHENDGDWDLVTRSEYDASGIRVSALVVTRFIGSDGNEVEQHTRTEWLNDPQNFTGYSQVIRETHQVRQAFQPDSSTTAFQPDSSTTAFQPDSSTTAFQPDAPPTDSQLFRLEKTVIYTFGLDEISQTTQTYAVDGTVSAPETQTFGHDGHGSVRVLLDAAQAIATVSGVRQLFMFDAYGNSLGFRESAAATTLLYSGEQFDQRVMMQYLRARYYDEGGGRFVGLGLFFGEPTAPQSFHKYLYTHANSINGIDPSGLSGIFGTSEFGYAVEDEVEERYRLSFPKNDVQFGKWARLSGGLHGLFKAKPDILGFDHETYMEIKPLSPTGDEAAIAQMPLRKLQFFGTSYKPDESWKAAGDIIFPDGIPTAIINVAGVIFYTDVVEITKDLAFFAAIATLAELQAAMWGYATMTRTLGFALVYGQRMALAGAAAGQARMQSSVGSLPGVMLGIPM